MERFPHDTILSILDPHIHFPCCCCRCASEKWINRYTTTTIIVTIVVVVYVSKPTRDAPFPPIVSLAMLDDGCQCRWLGARRHSLDANSQSSQESSTSDHGQLCDERSPPSFLLSSLRRTSASSHPHQRSTCIQSINSHDMLQLLLVVLLLLRCSECKAGNVGLNGPNAWMHLPMDRPARRTPQ